MNAKREKFFRFLEDENNLAIVSPRRSGVHLLALSLFKMTGKDVLFFDGKENIEFENIIAVHTHDDNLTFNHKNTLYLYRRNFLNSIWSKMMHEEADMNDEKRIIKNIELYTKHISHWVKKARCVITYKELLETKEDITMEDTRNKYPYVMKSDNNMTYYLKREKWKKKHSRLFKDHMDDIV